MRMPDMSLLLSGAIEPRGMFGMASGLAEGTDAACVAGVDA
jgi:hypothetical protein